jgi:hypothetical protein
MPSICKKALLLIVAAALGGIVGREVFAEPSQKPLVHHDLVVTLDPAGHRLEVRDRLRVPGALVSAPFTIALNADLKLKVGSGGLHLVPIRSRVQGSESGMDRDEHDPGFRVPVNIYRIEGATAGQELSFEADYEGTINYTVRPPGAEYARAFSESPGVIEEQGVYLAGSTYWVPQIGDALMTYTLAVELPSGWKSVSQGERTATENSGAGARESWSVATPTQEAHLIAARFTEYSRDAGAVKVMAFLRTPDAALAERYLDATAQYLDMYDGLIGPYPYSKFALVENFWETGYGMPSFTLLGEQVIRFPFILHSSYPHELLHNWWGNGVFVDYAGGNWCEGLTAYLADHLVAEQRGQGAEHRRAILQRITDYVTPENDFPISRFQGRHDAVTEAVGYGKTAMVFNMLREKVGDTQFAEALQAFYRDNRFRVASFDNIRRSFETVSGLDLRAFFEQWIKHTGAPELEIENATGRAGHLDLALSQVQGGSLLDLEVPVVIETDQGIEARKVFMRSDKRIAETSFDVAGTPQRVEIDPQFQLYRRLSPFEIPPSLSKAFGAKNVLIVVNAERAALYAGLVQAWKRDGVEVVKDTEIDSLPADKAVWILGAGNRFASAIAEALAPYGASLDAGGLRTGNAFYPHEGRSLVAAVRHPQNPNAVMIYVSAPSEVAANALARKLPHYGKYSWLVFAGDEATNEATGEWPVGDTPLARNLTANAGPIKIAPRKALAEVKPAFDVGRMRADVEWLASPEREGRGPGSRGLDAAANYIAERFERLGLSPLMPGAQGGDRYFQPFTITGENGETLPARNVIGVLPGAKPDFSGQALVVSAHYDHLGFGWPDARAGARGRLHPGADDNASGVAVMLELARLMANTRPDRTIIFAAFAGEEEGMLGSRYYVNAAQAPGAAFPLSGHIADVNLDTVGRLENGKVAILDAASAREWPFIFLGAGAVTGVPVQTVMQDLDASDDRSFVAAGVPAVQLFASIATDYHRPTDTPDKIDYAGMGKIAAVLKEAVDYLAARGEPLTFLGAGAAAQPRGPAAPAAPRRAATGIVPDMTDQGEGVRVGSVQPGSGAEKAGLKPGDRLLALGGVKTANLRALADALRDLQPGQSVEVEFAREAAILRRPLELGER